MSVRTAQNLIKKIPSKNPKLGLCLQNSNHIKFNTFFRAHCEDPCRLPSTPLKDPWVALGPHVESLEVVKPKVLWALCAVSCLTSF